MRSFDQIRGFRAVPTSGRTRISAVLVGIFFWGSQFLPPAHGGTQILGTSAEACGWPPIAPASPRPLSLSLSIPLHRSDRQKHNRCQVRPQTLWATSNRSCLCVCVFVCLCVDAQWHSVSHVFMCFEIFSAPMCLYLVVECRFSHVFSLQKPVIVHKVAH